MWLYDGFLGMIWYGYGRTWIGYIEGGFFSFSFLYFRFFDKDDFLMTEV